MAKTTSSKNTATKTASKASKVISKAAKAVAKAVKPAPKQAKAEKKEIEPKTNINPEQKETSMANSMYADVIGKKCIIRCTNAGVFYGTVDAVDENYAVKLSKVRKLWYWDGAAAVEEIALNGVKRPKECKFTVTVDSMVVTEVVQVIPASNAAIKCIEAVDEWKA